MFIFVIRSWFTVKCLTRPCPLGLRNPLHCNNEARSMLLNLNANLMPAVEIMRDESGLRRFCCCKATCSSSRCCCKIGSIKTMKNSPKIRKLIAFSCELHLEQTLWTLIFRCQLISFKFAVIWTRFSFKFFPSIELRNSTKSLWVRNSKFSEIFSFSRSPLNIFWRQFLPMQLCKRRELFESECFGKFQKQIREECSKF